LHGSVMSSDASGTRTAHARRPLQRWCRCAMTSREQPTNPKSVLTHGPIVMRPYSADVIRIAPCPGQTACSSSLWQYSLQRPAGATTGPLTTTLMLCSYEKNHNRTKLLPSASLRIIGTVCIVFRTGSMKRYGVHPSICLFQHGPTAANLATVQPAH